MLPLVGKIRRDIERDNAQIPFYLWMLPFVVIEDNTVLSLDCGPVTIIVIVLLDDKGAIATCSAKAGSEALFDRRRMRLLLTTGSPPGDSFKQ